jgi:hypothetical protein
MGSRAWFTLTLVATAIPSCGPGAGPAAADRSSSSERSSSDRPQASDHGEVSAPEVRFDLSGDAPSGKLQAAIVAPAALDSPISGEPVVFQGSATGGNPPYSFTWQSDIDGSFGNSATMTSSSLSVHDHSISLRVVDSSGAVSTSVPISLHVLPTTFDWSHRVLPTAPPAAGDWMTPVKSQGTCGSCWAFAALAAVEAKWNIQNANPNLDIDLSEQFVIDCWKGAVGCGGGAPEQALDVFITATGVPVESCDPFQGKDTSCPGQCKDGKALSLWRISGTKSFVPPSLDKAAVQKWTRDALVHDGPVPRHLGGMYAWSSVTHKCSNLQGDHYVTLVGYDHPSKLWIAKNSWGPTWNGNGYFEVAYGECGMDASSTVVDKVIPP